jgi:hypothetical protein
MKDQATVEDVTYEAFEQTYPQLIPTLKQLIHTGESKSRIVTAVRQLAPTALKRATIEFVVDYLLQRKTGP